MGTPWDHAASRYLEEWVPRFVPYHLDLVRELALVEGQKVLVARAGPGAEVLAVARAVGSQGIVRAVDTSADMVRICAEQIKRAGFGQVTCAQGEPVDVGDEPWDAIVCAFGLWTMPNRASVLTKWRSALTRQGKVGILAFGPPDDTGPFELLAQALLEVEPNAVAKPPRVEATRETTARMFEEGGLSLVRHTVLRHTLSFPTAEAFVQAISEGRTWRKVWEELGPERSGRVAARFYECVGGPTAPMSFEPTVTLAVAAQPGAEVELASRPSAVAPPLSTPPPSSGRPTQR